MDRPRVGFATFCIGTDDTARHDNTSEHSCHAYNIRFKNLFALLSIESIAFLKKFFKTLSYL